MADLRTPRNKENFVIRAAKGLGYWFLGTFMSTFVCAAMIVLIRGTIMLKIFVALCTLTITMGLFFNWAHYAAKRDRNAAKFHNMEYDRYMPLKMSIAAPIVSYGMLIALYLCKLGIIPDIFNWYMWIDMWTVPFIKMFTDSTTIDGISWTGILGITFLVLLQPLTITATYLLTYNDVDVTKLVLYKNDK
ncbi:MAG: hypothetical protein J1F11_13130 [Oscillospiraceae bacterium]|nr:hypothetical protein [Oscillospiraceae bacterium]